MSLLKIKKALQIVAVHGCTMEFVKKELLKLHPNVLGDVKFMDVHARCYLCKWAVDLANEGKLPLTSEQCTIIAEGTVAQITQAFDGVPTPEELIRVLTDTAPPQWFAKLIERKPLDENAKKHYVHDLLGMSTENKITGTVLPFDMSEYEKEITNNNRVIDALVEGDHERIADIAQELGYSSPESLLLVICLDLANRHFLSTDQPFWFTSDALVDKIDSIGWPKVRQSLVDFIDEKRTVA